jgi:hypothetical protein
MFVALARYLATSSGTTAAQGAERILTQEPAVISQVMEDTWSRGGVGLLRGTPATRLSSPPRSAIGIRLATTTPPFWSSMWHHLIYAYMIENTRAYEILGRVIAEFTQGERLGILQEDAAYQWLRTTEELFYKDASPIQPFNLVSRIRPDIAATRRNAYYRMFGMDLNHGRDGSPTYPYTKPPVANREFVATFEDFLREVWRAIENARNFLANNPTDFPAIQDLADRLQNMLTARRGGAFDRPNLSREEFLAVNLMGWMHLTLLFDTAIVRALSAAGPSPEERLRQVGDRVGLPAHGRSHSYFLIAPRVSQLLIAIERGDFNSRAGAESLAAPGPIQTMVSDVIHHWSLISGRDMKSAPVRMSAATPATTPPAPAMAATAPMSAPMSAPAPTAATNGTVPAGKQ